MKVFFDISNLLSLIHSSEQDEYNDCMRMLKENFDIHFSFSKEEIDAMKGDDKDDFMAWIRKLGDVSSEITWNDDRFKDTFNPYKLGREYLMAVYCTQSSQAEAGKGALLIAEEGKELETISSLLFESNQFIDEIMEKIAKWSDLDPYISPCTDIVIVDQFVLSDNSLLASNIVPLCKELCSKTHKQKVNIVIFTLKDDPKTKAAPNWEKVRDKIKDSVGGKFKPNVTFVTASKGNIQEHDRTIFTNYKLFVSGDTYNYFDSTGKKITDGRWLHVHSNAHRKHMQSSLRFLEDMQGIIYTIRNNPSLIKEDKISNFLKFS